MRLEYPDLKRAVLKKQKEFKATKVLIEDKTSGTQLLQELKREGLYQVMPFTPPAGMDKASRLYAQTTAFEAGLVVLPKWAPWLDEYVRELTGFPGCKHNDQVDSTTQGLLYLRQRRLTIYEVL